MSTLALDPAEGDAWVTLGVCRVLASTARADLVLTAWLKQCWVPRSQRRADQELDEGEVCVTRWFAVRAGLF